SEHTAALPYLHGLSHRTPEPPMNVQPLKPEQTPSRRKLAARLEPFDSYWQAPDDVESGYASFAAYYRANYLQHLPGDRGARILVISCGPGYLVNVLAQA